MSQNSDLSSNEDLFGHKIYDNSEDMRIEIEVKLILCIVINVFIAINMRYHMAGYVSFLEGVAYYLDNTPCYF